MDEPSLYCAILLVFTSLTCSSQLGNAKSVDYGIATLSTSWTINNPTPILHASEFVWRPILFRRGLLSRFTLGFCCNFAYTDCIVGVFIQKQTSVNEDSITDAPQLVWSANRNHSVTLHATLHLTQHGDLTLADADGTSVWSTNTGRAGGGGGKYSVLGLNLTEDGNLVLFDQNNATVWQSFDYPTDSLLPGQKLVLGQKLIASTSASNWSQGLFSLAIHPNPDPYYSLLAYVESNPPLVYFRSYLNGTSDHQVYVKFENGSFNVKKSPLVGSSAQFIRLEPDGRLRVYEWVGNNWNAVDLLIPDIGDCGYPMACGNYGVCSSNGECGCLQEFPSSNIFRQINYRQPSLGCSLVTPISCNHSQYHTLLELQNISYFFNLKDTNGDYLDAKIELEDCKKSCLKNCSCKAALFAYDGSYNYNQSYYYNRCLLLSEVYSLQNNEAGDDSISLFLKVQNF